MIIITEIKQTIIARQQKLQANQAAIINSVGEETFKKFSERTNNWLERMGRIENSVVNIKLNDAEAEEFFSKLNINLDTVAKKIAKEDQDLDKVLKNYLKKPAVLLPQYQAHQMASQHVAAEPYNFSRFTRILTNIFK